MRISGSTVLVTGASMGIGAAAAAEFARQGATVLLVARSESKLAHTAQRIVDAGGSAHVHVADVSTLDGVRALVESVEDQHEVPDIVVNNAGSGRFRYLDHTSPEEFSQQAAVPFLAAGWICTALLPAMVARGSGRIVNVNSPASRVVWPSAGGYASARWALRGLTEGMRADLKGTGVGVTEVVPGEVESQYWANNPGSAERLPAVAKLLPALSCEKVAVEMVRAVVRERDEVVFPALLRVLTAGSRLAPRLVRRLAAIGADSR